MRTFKLFLCVVFFSLSTLSFAQSVDKATLYIVRTSSFGAAVNFKYFIEDEFIGKTNYGKYLKLELTPGEHLIWAKSENRSYVKVKVEAGKTYVINAIPQMGGFKAGVGLKAVNNPKEKELARIKKYISKKKLLVYDEEKRKLEQSDYASLIKKGLTYYSLYVIGSPDLEKLTNPIEL